VQAKVNAKESPPLALRGHVDRTALQPPTRAATVYLLSP
jgi:hypothetical protein